MGAVHKLNPTSGLTQCQKVVRHVDENGGITAWEAISNYGITRLAARVHELRGTENAMRGEDIGDGYVRYVPAHRERLKFLRTEMEFVLMFGTHGQIATKLPQLFVQYNNAYHLCLRNGSL